MNIVILAGGGGTRLWPMSRAKSPKQFWPLVSELTMFEETFNRFKNSFPLKNIFVSTTEQTVKLAKKILPEIPNKNYIVEPEKRDTGPAMAYASAYLATHADPDEPMAFIASDHMIKNPQLLIKCLLEAEKIIKKTQQMMDIAIVPTFPNVNLGYTKIGKLIKKIGNIKIYQFKGHKEKPDLATAKKFIASGNYLWHANYFMWTPKLLLEAYKQYAPGIYQPIEKIISAFKHKNIKAQEQIIKKEFHKTEKISIDYAVAEKIEPKNVLIIKGEFGWSDIGSWSMLYDQLTDKQDHDKNVIKANLVHKDTKNCLVYGPKEKLIATIGLDNIAIIDTPDALLVSRKDQSHNVKKIVEILKEEGREKYL
ncbi:MAG: sugar phosphate nucleotidyltransferase [Patescibacteria group bacterium]|nr:sugar phosphate nucleotidyltransferase [Patescibacteria group bacterium]